MVIEAKDKAVQGFRRNFGRNSGTQVVKAPLRICPVGAHVDHQFGTLLGMAIDRALWLAFVPRQEPRVRFYSDQFREVVEIDLAISMGEKHGDWTDYLRGVVWALRRREYQVLHGWDAYLYSDTPIGGLSSSAALGLSCLSAFDRANHLSLSRGELALLHYELEHDFVGVSIGLNDPTMIMHSKKGFAVHLDCLSGRWERVRWGGEGNQAGTWCLLYSGVGRSLAKTAYNRRVEECHKAATRLARLGDVHVEGRMGLGKIPVSVYEQYAGDLGETHQRRARHFFTEVERVQQAVDCWSRGDLEELGRLMNESCQSSIQNYQCGSPPLIDLAHCAREAPGCYGSRFSGGGFGGFCVALVEPGQGQAVIDHVRREYQSRQPEFAARFEAYLCQGDDGLEAFSCKGLPEETPEVEATGEDEQPARSSP